VAAVVLSLLSAVCFGGYSVGIRLGQARVADLDAGVCAVITTAATVVVPVAVVAQPERLDAGELWPFFAIGLVVPGLTQFLYQRAIRAAGAARPAVVVGAAPLLSVLLALVFLDEPVQAALLAGTVLVVAGTMLLATERGRPRHVRRVGLVLAGVCTMLFAARDNLVRLASQHGDAAPLPAAAAPILAGAVTAWLILAAAPSAGPRLARVRAAWRPMVPAGLAFAGGLSLLVLAFTQGRVSVVAPLNATQSLFAVWLAHLAFPSSERVGRRVVASAVLVVAGAAIVAATR
jgi:drug/metabolite transporter (DMT)-like permease